MNLEMIDKLTARAGLLIVSGLLVCAPAQAQHADSDAFSMPIQDAFKITGRGTIITGRVASGSVMVGETICVPLTTGETLAVELEGVEMFRKVLDRAEAGQTAGLLVASVNADDVKKGEAIDTQCDAVTQPEQEAE